MRILVHDYAGHPFQIQLSRQLAVVGHEVVHGYASGLVTPRGDLQRRAQDPTNLSVRAFPMSPAYRAHKYKFLRRQGYESEYGRGVAQFIKTWRPEIVISGNTPSHPQLTIAQATRASSGRFVSWIQDFYGLAVDKLARKKLPLLGALAGAWYRRLDQKVFALSHGVMVITEDFVPLVTAAGVTAERILILPNWAPLEDLNVAPRINSWGARQGVATGFNFIYTGTLAMKHNPDLLLQLALAFRSEPAVRVLVISEGPGADWLHTPPNTPRPSNLQILPFQPFSDLPEILGSADVLLAILEPAAGVFSVPSKVLTYHCAQRAILAALPSENLAAKIIRQQGSGLCVDPRQVPQFIAAGRSLFDHVERRQAAGERARAYAEETFNLQRIVPRVVRFLNQLG